MRVAWATDIHLNHASSEQVERFYAEVLAADSDILLLGGDIGEAPTVAGYLRFLEERLRMPIYFVLGNHDFYQGSIVTMRKRAKVLSRESQWLRWLPATDVVPLTSETGLIGHDGWSDGRFGDVQSSRVVLNDYIQIQELRGLSKPQLIARLHALGDEAADYLEDVLTRALARFAKVILVTHVPPFREACLYQGRPGNSAWLPHFTDKAVGDTLRIIMSTRPNQKLTVLCGHTHHAAEIDVLPNLTVIVGAAVYGRPHLQSVLAL